MEKTLTVGRTYAVTTSTTCDVTDANGTLITTAAAGQQVVFVAPTTTVTFSDDSASVVAVFKLALAKTRLFEQLGGGRLPTGYLPALFLESTGTQYINTKYIPNNETGFLLDQEKRVSGDNIPMGCRTSPSSDTRIYLPRSTVSGDPYNSYCGFGWGKWTNLGSSRIGRQIGKLNWQNNRVAEINTLTRSLATLGFEPTQPIYIFAANVNGQASLIWRGRIYVAQISQGAETIRNYTPAIDAHGLPCMVDSVTAQPFRNSGTGSFIVGLTVEQARKLGNLPADATTKTLTVSLPASIVDGETVTDDAVQAALDAAAAKGWTITIQTYTD